MCPNNMFMTPGAYECSAISSWCDMAKFFAQRNPMHALSGSHLHMWSLSIAVFVNNKNVVICKVSKFRGSLIGDSSLGRTLGQLDQDSLKGVLSQCGKPECLHVQLAFPTTQSWNPYVL